MNYHLEQEIAALKKSIGRQAADVEAAVRQSLESLVQQNEVLALEIIEHDDAIDREEVRLEEECLKILALHQPVAGDLRYIITLLKVNNELERIGDLAGNIAERVIDLIHLRTDWSAWDISPMFQEIFSQLKKALDSLMGRDCFLASQVIASDDIVDEMHRNNYRLVVQRLKEERGSAEMFLNFLNISRNLERIADACTNIGEDVLYLEQGRIVRHVHEKKMDKGDEYTGSTI